MRGEKKPVAIRTPNDSIIRLAQPRSALADGIEHGLNVDGRTRDDTEDLAGRGLLLQRLSMVLSRLR